MGTLILIGLIIAAFIGAQMWAAHKASQAAKGEAATEALKDVVESNRPVDGAERQQLRDKYRK